jgi:hypothetical protein
MLMDSGYAHERGFPSEPYSVTPSGVEISGMGEVIYVMFVITDWTRLSSGP